MTPAQLIDTASRHQVYLEGLKTGLINDFSSVFAETETAIADIFSALRVNSLDELQRGQLTILLTKLRDSQIELYDKAINHHLEQMPDIAAYEAAFEGKAIQSVMKPKDRKRVTLPKADRAYAEAVRRPIQATGDTMPTLWDHWKSESVKRVNNAVLTGYAQGKTVNDILKSVTGTKALRFKDGLQEVSRRQAKTVIRTAVQHVAATAREVTYQQNSDVVKGVVWVSTLDGRTSSACRSLDGKQYPVSEGPRPPIHPNCRSTTAPDLVDDFDFLDEGATRSSKDGYVDADQTYYDWLKKQSPEFQDSVLGKTRAQLFRDGGLTSDQFGKLQLDKNFNPITLDQMRELEPLAFQRAGLVDNFVPEDAPTSLPGRPGAGTATGKVWDIADELKTKHGRLPTRQEMLEAGRALGINDSTIGVQYGKWKKSVGDTIAPIKPPPTVTVAAKQLEPVIKDFKAGTTNLPEPPVVPPTASTPAVRNGQETWDKLKAELDALQLTPVARQDLSLAYKQLSQLEHRYGKPLAIDRMSVPHRELYASVRETIRKSGSNVNQEARAAIHTRLAKLKTSSRAVKLDITDSVSASDAALAKKATAFLEDVTDASMLRKSVKVEIHGQARASYYSEINKSIVIKKGSDIRSYVHELGHWIEMASQQNIDRAVAWVERRFKSTNASWFERKRSDTGAVMRLFEDEFVARGGITYTSRLYSYKDRGKDIFNSTEVLTTGIERLFEDPLSFYRKDPDHFEFVVRTLLALW